MDIQNFSVNDGDGIHTNIFLAGCPLKCAWCANPESHNGTERVSYNSKLCIGCGKCKTVCPFEIGTELNTEEGRKKCVECGKCVEICPNKARYKLINEEKVDKIIEEASKHEIFFRFSGGGITFSGGEPFYQMEVLDSLSENLYDEGFDLAVETSGFWDFEKAEKILKRMNLIFVDIKHMDSEIHKKFTGVPNELILKNIERISKLKIDTVVRVPVIKGVNADDENIRKTAEFVKEHFECPKIELLPYHRYGEAKYEALYIEKPSLTFGTPSKEEMKHFMKIIEEAGVENISYR